MPAAEVWSLIHAERAVLADQLTELTDEQWSTRSLCELSASAR
jgi:hypothetical protein